MKNIVANYKNEGITINLSEQFRNIAKGIKGFLEATDFPSEDAKAVSGGTMSILSWLKDFLAIGNQPT